jgi:HAD superfamily hydrolase (TIGR01509 family)
MIRGIIFDMDGVIVDSEEIWFRVISDVCREYGHEYTEELYKRVIGTPAARILKREFDIKDSEDEIRRKYVERFILFIKNNGIKEMPGIRSLLERLKKKFTLALASSSIPELIDLIIDDLGFRKYFSVIMSSSQAARPKPEPDLFLAVAKKIGIKPEECLVIEDAPNGVKAAKSAGMKCIALNSNPSISKDDLKQADIIVKSLDDISSIDLNNL